MILLALTASCVSFESRVGYEIKYTIIEQIKVGSFSKGDTLELIGFYPTLKAGFGEDIWYYTYEKRSKYNNLLARQILEVKFNKQNIVASKKVYTELDSVNIEMDDETTENNIKRQTWFNKIFGGVG